VKHKGSDLARARLVGTQSRQKQAGRCYATEMCEEGTKTREYENDQ